MVTEYIPVALSIAGSDSGGGAGIQADLKAFQARGVFGTTALSALTAQNLEGISWSQSISPQGIVEQMRQVFIGFPVGAMKTGLLWDKDTVLAVANCKARYASQIPWVLDPVMIATSGARLTSEETPYSPELLTHSTLITPNLDEAKVLLTGAIPEKPQDLALALHHHYQTSVLLKGGHGVGDPIDILVHASQVYRWEHRRIHGVHSHGSGCILSAFITAELAKGVSIPKACETSIEHLHQAFLNPCPISADISLLNP